MANTAAGASTPSISSKMFRSPSAIIPVRTAPFTPAITTTQEANKMNLVPLGNIVAALVFAFVGIFIFVIAFLVMDKLTPYHLWKEIVQEHNMALAILVGAMSLGICIIIAAAIH
jgi:putative membrane protein